MFRRFSANNAVYAIFVDLVTIAIAMFLAYSFRYLFNDLPLVQSIKPVNFPLLLYLVFPILWVAVLLQFSIYDGRKNLRAVDEFGSLTLGSSLAMVAMAGILYLSYRDVSRLQFLLFFLLGFIILFLWRFGLRMAQRWNLVKGISKRKVLILGAGSVGRKLDEQILCRIELGLNMVGFLDDDPQKQSTQGDILGGTELAREIIIDQDVDDVIIALPRSAYSRLNQVATELHDLPVRVWVIPDYFSLSLHQARVEEFAGIPMLDLRAPALDEYQRMVKRAFDLIIVILCLPFVLILVGLIALAIRLEGSGPIFFRQKRVGENGRLFDMIKFRSMVPDAEKLKHLVETHTVNGELIHKRTDDPRVTRVGRFLRRMSLDELPQIFNVLKGEMSLVGPRPEMTYLVEKYEPWQRKRFAVPQGMTGWWQINGRSDKPMHLHTEEDLYYVQHYSIWLDLQILVRTVWVVVRGKGAY
jgi:exopolysaccharide biosynthesis polyprenyl glycosylphosphotransferase